MTFQETFDYVTRNWGMRPSLVFDVPPLSPHMGMYDYNADMIMINPKNHHVHDLIHELVHATLIRGRMPRSFDYKRDYWITHEEWYSLEEIIANEVSMYMCRELNIPLRETTCHMWLLNFARKVAFIPKQDMENVLVYMLDRL